MYVLGLGFWALGKDSVNSLGDFNILDISMKIDNANRSGAPYTLHIESMASLLCMLGVIHLHPEP